ncbi:MAG TPA: protease modulator HflC [Chromatiales bacterium]|nr:protease modulator HflC [Thiotrichales bacterium]HIP69373.1 protease modulator HflC [Chromatiales bacterium]
MSAFIVDQREKVILFNLGKIRQVDLKPGLHFKWPFVNNVIKFDGRILTLDESPEQFLTSEKKNVMVDFYVKWRIEDVGQFYRATGGQERSAEVRLSQIIKDGLRNEFAKRTIRQVVSGERGDIMKSINEISRELAKGLGIEVVDVRISRIDLPERISESVYDRMRAERSRIAKELRAQGQEAAERIRADADRQRTILLAEAYREAQQLRGAGDAKSAETYANAYQKDPEFYSFYRSLQSYRKAFQNKSDLMVLDPDSDFFRYFTAPTGSE